MEEQLKAIALKLDTLDELKKSLADVKTSLATVESWRPEMEKQVADLAQSVNFLVSLPPHPEPSASTGSGEPASATTSPVVSSAPFQVDPGSTGVVYTFTQPSPNHEIFPHPTHPPLSPIPRSQQSLPSTSAMIPSHHPHQHHQQQPNFTAPPPPPTFTQPVPSAPSPPQFSNQSFTRPKPQPHPLKISLGSVNSNLLNHNQAIPHVAFPPFDGENPRLWKARCENYFEMYAIHPTLWIKLATMHFTTNAALWLQSMERRIRDSDWEGFCSLLSARFGRDQQQSLIRQFFTLRQTTTVAEYIDRFETLMNHLLSYTETIHPLYFLTRFMDGLREDIRAVVLVQRPQELDAAFTLALLQEEVADARRRDIKKPDSQPTTTRFPARTTPALPLPPPPTSKPVPSPTQNPDTNRPSSQPSRLSELRAFRRAKGLCFRCGEKWNPEHKCGPSVQLHVISELLEALELDQETLPPTGTRWKRKRIGQMFHDAAGLHDAAGQISRPELALVQLLQKFRLASYCANAVKNISERSMGS